MIPELITVKIPQDRIGVLIGDKGVVKWDIEKRSE
jgi:rRNA processing protein Krr1/Pno1